jgi:hypothetical protein
MFTTQRRRVQCRQVAELAREVLGELFELHAGEPARALRVCRRSDAVMLLLRFDPGPAGSGADPELQGRVDAALMAMFEMATEVVSQRSGAEIVAGNFSVCATTGLAVFTMRVAREAQRRPGDRWRDVRGRGSREGESLRLANRSI